jgi:hypothetical protein
MLSTHWRINGVGDLPLIIITPTSHFQRTYYYFWYRVKYGINVMFLFQTTQNEYPICISSNHDDTIKTIPRQFLPAKLFHKLKPLTHEDTKQDSWGSNPRISSCAGVGHSCVCPGFLRIQISNMFDFRILYLPQNPRVWGLDTNFGF